MFNNKSENVKKIDISPILKNVEQCIQSGLEDKLHMFFNDFEKYPLAKWHADLFERYRRYSGWDY